MVQFRTRWKTFIILAQKNICLLCDYPLALQKHFHHIIAKDDGGPDHYLNLVALCPNHHWLVERIKRHIIPNQSSLSNHWLKSSMAALQLYEDLPEEAKRILDILSKPHKMSKVLSREVPEDFLNEATNDLIKEDHYCPE